MRTPTRPTSTAGAPLFVAVTSSRAAFAATALFARSGPESVGVAVVALAVCAVVVAAALERRAAG